MTRSLHLTRERRIVLAVLEHLGMDPALLETAEYDSLILAAGVAMRDGCSEDTLRRMVEQDRLLRAKK